MSLTESDLGQEAQRLVGCGKLSHSHSHSQKRGRFALKPPVTGRQLHILHTVGAILQVFI